jgi:hypothetical protein
VSGRGLRGMGWVGEERPKSVFSHHSRPARQLWKAVTYEALRLVFLGTMLRTLAGIAVWLTGGTT